MSGNPWRCEACGRGARVTQKAVRDWIAASVGSRTFNRAEIRDAFAMEPDKIGGMMRRLLDAGAIERVSPGRYRAKSERD